MKMFKQDKAFLSRKRKIYLSYERGITMHELCVSNNPQKKYIISDRKVVRYNLYAFSEYDPITLIENSIHFSEKELRII